MGTEKFPPTGCVIVNATESWIVEGGIGVPTPNSNRANGAPLRGSDEPVVVKLRAVFIPSYV